MPRAEREEVYAAIDGERRYQDDRWGVEHDEMTGLNAFALYIGDYSRELSTQLSRNEWPAARDMGLDTVRKIGALAVACMESNGVRHRGPDGQWTPSSWTAAAVRERRPTPLEAAVQALGAMPEGYCFCSSDRIGDDSKTHEPECAHLRAVLNGDTVNA